MSRFLSLVGLAAIGLRGVIALPSTPVLSNTTGEMHIMDEKPNFPAAPNTIATCRWWWDNDGSISCKSMPAEWGISMANFLAWNPSITSDCGNYVKGLSYCIEAPTNSAPSSTTTTTTSAPTPPTTTSPGSTTTPTPIQEGMVDNCNKFHFVEPKENCDNIAKTYGITRAQFVQYNPEVGSTCSGMWANVYVCVGVVGGSPVTTTPPTTTGNGIATPTPTQDGMVDNCDKFHFVEKNQNCDTIAKQYGITRAQFVKYNTEVGDDCRFMWASVYVCVHVIGMTPSPTTMSTTTKTGNSVPTPTPIQDGMISNCNKFQFVEEKMTCQSILNQYKITLAQFYKWNPDVGSGCNNLWAKTYACVGVSS